MKVINKIILILTMVVLTACGGNNLAKDDSVDYQSAKQTLEIKVPEMKEPVTQAPSGSERKNKE